jgi:hypothetical protein
MHIGHKLAGQSHRPSAGTARSVVRGAGVEAVDVGLA